MPVTAYSTVAASNNGAPPNGAPEGQAPSTINDTIRQIMADIAVEAQTNNVKVLKLVAGTNTITADMDPELAAYVAGMIVVMTPAATNTGPATLAIDAGIALDIQKLSGSALIAGDLVIGVPALLVLDSGADDWILINPQTESSAISGSFPGSFTGFTTTPTPTINYTKVGVTGGLSLVTLYIPGTLATSNATTWTMTGIPTNLQTSVGMVQPIIVRDNGADAAGLALITAASPGTLQFGLGVTTGGFTASGSKGLSLQEIAISYRVTT